MLIDPLSYHTVAAEVLGEMCGREMLVLKACRVWSEEGDPNWQGRQTELARVCQVLAREAGHHGLAALRIKGWKELAS